MTTSTSFKLSTSHARVTSIKFTKQELGRESVSDKHSQCSDSGPIIKKCSKEGNDKLWQRISQGVEKEKKLGNSGKLSRTNWSQWTDERLKVVQKVLYEEVLPSS